VVGASNSCYREHSVCQTEASITPISRMGRLRCWRMTPRNTTVHSSARVSRPRRLQHRRSPAGNGRGRENSNGSAQISRPGGLQDRRWSVHQPGAPVLMLCRLAAAPNGAATNQPRATALGDGVNHPSSSPERAKQPVRSETHRPICRARSQPAPRRDTNPKRERGPRPRSASPSSHFRSCSPRFHTIRN
jgi:hypothetical protein